MMQTCHTVTDTDWTMSDFTSGMDFAAFSSHQAKSTSVKESNALDRVDQDPTDARLDYRRGGHSGTSPAENAT